MIRTYIDSGILIVAARGIEAIAAPAIEVLTNPDRVFVSSVFVQLEVLPKPIYFGRQEEVTFYRAFFAAVVAWANPLDDIIRDALIEAQTHGLSALDALHVVAAAHLGAEELFTTEGPDKPIHRTTRVRVVSLHIPPGI